MFTKGSRKSINTAYNTHLFKHQVEEFFCDCPGVPEIMPGQMERNERDFIMKEHHIKTIHEGYFGCIKCNKYFQTQNGLDTHLVNHSNGKGSNRGLLKRTRRFVPGNKSSKETIR